MDYLWIGNGENFIISKLSGCTHKEGNEYCKDGPPARVIQGYASTVKKIKMYMPVI